MDINFIQLGDDFFNIAKIEHIQINHKRNTIRMYTDELTAGAGDDGTGVESTYFDYELDSPEAQALLSWLRGRTTVLTPSTTL